MSHKLQFQVIHTSGSDEDHPGRGLEFQGPTSKGWQSARFCVYPQEIVLSLKEPSKVIKLQILSHQYNIASKIEIFIAYPVSQGSKSLNGINFRRLGYVPLSENEATHFKARELKSVHLKAEGQFLKLLVHKNYVNKVNLYNQVSIVAINIIGHSLAKECDDNANYFCRTDDLITSYMGINENNLNTAPIKKQARYEAGKFISPLDDLAFDMYQDPETAQLIRRLEEKKMQAVLEERFDYANKLKQAMGDLYKVGERLGKFEVEKRRAVEMEDFELAKSKKLQSDEYRLYVYKQLNVFDLLELKKESKYEKVIEQRKRNVEVVTTPVLSPPPLQHIHTPEEVKLPPVSTQNVITQKPSLINDERPLPALHGKSIEFSKEVVTESDPEAVENHDETYLDTPHLTEKEEREASIIIDIFGMIVARKLFSKSWKYRQESVWCFSDELNNPTERSTENSPSRICRAVVTALKKGMNDQVFVVLQDSVELLKKLLLDYMPKKGLSKLELSRAVEKLFPIILKRTGDLVPRSRNMMFDVAIRVASSKEIKPLNIVPSIVCEPIKSKKQAPWRLMKSQIDMIKALIPELGVDNKNGFDIDSIMKILTKGLEHANGIVRDSSLECIMEVYKIVKEPMKKYFPPDDATTRKNPLYVKLFDGFDKADGKLTAAERKVLAMKQKEESDKSQEKEVKALQEQLEQLRSLAQQQVAANTNVKKENKKSEVKDDTTVNEKSPKEEAIKPEMERLCIFCGEQNETFTDEQLDIHYWKSCPMLKRCHSCTEVVEISEMNQHLVTECENKEKFMKCKVCSVIISKSDEETHIQSEQCQKNSSQKFVTRCPLCQVIVEEGDDNWKTHLIDNCQINSERLHKNKGKNPAPKVAQKTPALGRGRGGKQSVRGRGRGRGGSKIPSKTPVRKK